MNVEVKGIPLRGRDGSVKGYALCDPEDFASLNDLTWTMTSSGYAVRSGRDRRTILMHRHIMGLGPRGREIRGALEVDHLNGDPLDNRKANLRVVTRAQNSQNLRPRKGGTSKFRGVFFERRAGKWRGEVTLFYKKHHVGLFETEQEAHEAVVAFRAKHMPFSTEAA